MRTRELIRRIVRLTASRELETAPVEVVAELIDSANEALSEVWRLMPAEMRRLPMSSSLKPATSIPVELHTGSRWVGATLPEWVGCSIQMPDDPFPNRLVSENALERPHAGHPANDGMELPALLWQDAVHLPESSTMLGEDVYYELNGQHCRLTPWPYNQPIWARSDISPNTPGFYGVRGTGFTAPSLVDPLAGQAGIPRLIEPPPGWFLHILPRPASGGLLRYTLNVQGERITISDYRRDARLMIPDSLASELMRIAEQKVKATRLFVGSPELAKDIDNEAERSRSYLKNLVTSHVDAPASYGTPAGF